MGFDQSPNPPDHLYSQALQLKLYQAFIFSIPILFSIILFLLFYLFYLKKRASTFAHSPPVLPRTLTQPPPFIISVSFLLFFSLLHVSLTCTLHFFAYVLELYWVVIWFLNFCLYCYANRCVKLAWKKNSKKNFLP